MDKQPWILWEQRGGKGSFVGGVLERSLSLSATHRLRRCVQRSRIERLDLSTRTEIRSSHYGGVLCLALDRQECRYLLSGGTDGSIALYDLDEGAGKCRELGALSTSHGDVARHSLAISSLEWYPEDSGAFVSSSLDGRVLVWDAETMSVAGEFQLGAKVQQACTRAEAGRAVVACALSDDTIRLCDTTTMDSCHVLYGHKDAVTGVAWSPNNQHHLSSCSCDGTLKIWDVRKGGSQGELMAFDWHQDHTATARSVFGGQAAGVGVAGRASRAPGEASSTRPLLRMDRSREQAAKAHDGAIMSIKYSSCGNYLVSSGNDRKVRLWAADTGALAPINYDLPGNVSSLPYSMEIAAFSCSGDDLLLFPNGRSGDIAMIPLHSPSGRAIKILKGHVAAVTSIVYRPTLNQVISASRDGMIFLWDASVNAGDGGVEGFQPQHGTGAINFQIDSWSDDDTDPDPAEVPPPAHQPQRYFIPPIVQAYLDDSRRQRRQKDAPPAPPSTPGGALRIAFAKKQKTRQNV